LIYPSRLLHAEGVLWHGSVLGGVCRVRGDYTGTLNHKHAMRTRTRYITITEAAEGMTLAEDVVDHYRITTLPAGVVLSQENLQQLQAHQIEFICVFVPDTRSEAEVADEAADAARQVLRIFDKADLSNPVMAALYNQVLLYRSA